VINGADEGTNDDLTKERIERTLRQHSAKIVQNPMNSTFCVIVGNDRTVKDTSPSVLAFVFEDAVFEDAGKRRVRFLLLFPDARKGGDKQRETRRCNVGLV